MKLPKVYYCNEEFPLQILGIDKVLATGFAHEGIRFYSDVKILNNSHKKMLQLSKSIKFLTTKFLHIRS